MKLLNILELQYVLNWYHDFANAHIQYQANAWMDQRICNLWFSNVFVKAVTDAGLASATHPVVLLWDGCSAHSVTEFAHPNVRVIMLPPNCTSLIQPLDQGIISVVKRAYRKEVLTNLIAAIENNIPLLQQQGRRRTPGTAGLKFALDPHIGDVCRIVQGCWQSLQRAVIVNCWLKTRLLPVSVHNALSAGSNQEDRAKVSSENLSKHDGDLFLFNSIQFKWVLLNST